MIPATITYFLVLGLVLIGLAHDRACGIQCHISVQIVLVLFGPPSAAIPTYLLVMS